MIAHYFLLSLFIISGSIALLAAIFNWNWFFTASNAQSIVRRLGRLKARLLYGVCGVILISLAIYFFRTIFLTVQL